MTPKVGKKMQIVGEIIEYLSFKKNNWVTLKLEDGTEITINCKYCKEIK